MGRDSKEFREDNHRTRGSWTIGRFLASAGPGLTDLECGFAGAEKRAYTVDDMDLVPRNLIKIGVAEPGDEHLVSVT